MRAWTAFLTQNRGWRVFGQRLGFYGIYLGVRKRGVGGKRRKWHRRERWRELVGIDRIEVVGVLLSIRFMGRAMGPHGSRVVIDDRKLWGGVAGIAHNYTDREPLISEVSVYTYGRRYRCRGFGHRGP